MSNLTAYLIAYLKCRKNKRTKLTVLTYEQNFERHLVTLQNRLNAKTYRPKNSTCFVVTRPKLREAFAADFSDRVAHHLVIQALEAQLERRFIQTSYACRKTKGTHKAVADLQKALHQVTKNQTQNAYFLQLDIKSFFTSINKNILQKILLTKIRNPTLKYLAQEIVTNDPTKNCLIKGNPALLNQIPPHKSLFHAPDHKGLPIGNLTSQVFANVYLNILDQFIKRQLKVKYYFRYVDDMVLLSKNPNQLYFWREQINDFLKSSLDLELHPDKDKTGSVYQGIDFLGYVVKPTYILIRKRVVQNLTTKLYLFNKEFFPVTTTSPSRTIKPPIKQPYPAEADIKKALAMVNSYYGHFIHGNSYNLRKNIYTNHFGNLKDYLIPKDSSYNSFKIKTNMDIPLYRQVYTYQAYLYNLVKNFKRSHKYTLGENITKTCWELLDKIVVANSAPNNLKANYITEASVLFDLLKTRLRMAYDLKLIAHKKYIFIITKNEEIAKMLTGWLKWAYGQNKPDGKTS